VLFRKSTGRQGWRFADDRGNELNCPAVSSSVRVEMVVSRGSAERTRASKQLRSKRADATTPRMSGLVAPAARGNYSSSTNLLYSSTGNEGLGAMGECKIHRRQSPCSVSELWNLLPQRQNPTLMSARRDLVPNHPCHDSLGP
jgi:hypothetical protein